MYNTIGIAYYVGNSDNVNIIDTLYLSYLTNILYVGKYLIP